SPGYARAGISAVGGEHGRERPGTLESSRAAGERRGGRVGQPAAPVLAATLRADGAGGIDSGAGVRQCRQSAAGARHIEKAGNGPAAERGSEPGADRASAPDGECTAGVVGRRAGSVVRDLGDSVSDGAAGQWARQFYPARRDQLARAGGGGGAIGSDGRTVRA